MVGLLIKVHTLLIMLEEPYRCIRDRQVCQLYGGIDTQLDLIPVVHAPQAALPPVAGANDPSIQSGAIQTPKIHHLLAFLLIMRL